MSTTEIRRSLIAAADEWNETSAAATLTYLGTTATTVEDYGGPGEPTLAACEATGLVFSTMIVHASGNRPATWGPVMATNMPHCMYLGDPPEDEGNYQFTIETYLHDTDGSLLFNVGDQTLLSDLMGTMVHEVGHTFNFRDNPTSTYASVMNYPTVVGEKLGSRYRQGHPFDVNCALRERQPLSVKRIQRSCSGSVCAWSNPIAMTTWDRSYLTGGGGGRYVSGIFSLRWLGTYSSNPDAPTMVGATGSPGTQALAFTAPRFVPRAMLGLWMDRDNTRQRLFFVPPTQPAQNDRWDEFRLSQRTSTNDFASSTAVSVVTRCTSMTGWMVCGNQQELRTARAPVSVKVVVG